MLRVKATPKLAILHALIVWHSQFAATRDVDSVTVHSEGKSIQNYCVTQSDDRTPEQMGKQAALMDVNRDICNNDGACTYLEDAVDGKNVPSYWRKVAAMRECLNGDLCDVCLYIDTDAVMNPRRWRGLMDIRRLLMDRDFACAPDMMERPTRFNAGFFAVRNTEQGNAIMNAWWTSLPQDRWSRQKGKWFCSDKENKHGSLLTSKGRTEVGECAFSEKFYEQGAFIELILPQFEDRVNEVSPFVWNNWQRACNKGQIKHFMGINGALPERGQEKKTIGKEIVISTFLSGCVFNTSVEIDGVGPAPPYDINDPNADHTEEAMKANEKGDHMSTMASFRAAVRFQPYHEWTWENLAIALSDHKNPDWQADIKEVVPILRDAQQRVLSGGRAKKYQLAIAKGRAAFDINAWRKLVRKFSSADALQSEL